MNIFQFSSPNYERRDGSGSSVAGKSSVCEPKPSEAFGASPALPQTALTVIKSRLNTECLNARAGCRSTGSDILQAFRVIYAVSIVYYFSAVTPLSVYCCPRVETVMIRLLALSDYHRLAFPGTGSSISLEIFSSNILSFVFTVMET